MKNLTINDIDKNFTYRFQYKKDAPKWSIDWTIKDGTNTDIIAFRLRNTRTGITKILHIRELQESRYANTYILSNN
jgi:hypothetical protein